MPNTLQGKPGPLGSKGPPGQRGMKVGWCFISQITFGKFYILYFIRTQFAFKSKATILFVSLLACALLPIFFSASFVDV